MIEFLQAQCPQCGLNEGEVIEVRTQPTKRQSFAGMKPRSVSGMKRGIGVKFVPMPTVERLCECTKCGHEFVVT